MKRKNNLYKLIYSIENLELADSIARKGKIKQYGIKQHDKRKAENILKIHNSLKNKTYKTSEYTTFRIYEPKERVIYRLPYSPDRIVHHAVMNILEPIFVSTFTKDTFSCIKGRGIHGAWRAIKTALIDEEGTKYCLKIDIKKFYPNINHEILKNLLRRKFKDKDLLWLLDGIIDSADGLPIGNYLSQYLANFYLTYFDHWIKEQKHVKYYFRYADDIVILSKTKEELHKLLFEIKEYLLKNLKLEINKKYQVFPVDSRGIDFIGYVFRHDYIRLRKVIKKKLARSIKNKRPEKFISPYYGWLKYCDSVNLTKKLINDPNKKIPRLRHKSKIAYICRRENSNKENIEQRNNGRTL